MVSENSTLVCRSSVALDITAHGKKYRSLLHCGRTQDDIDTGVLSSRRLPVVLFAGRGPACRPCRPNWRPGYSIYAPAWLPDVACCHSPVIFASSLSCLVILVVRFFFFVK